MKKLKSKKKRAAKRADVDMSSVRPLAQLLAIKKAKALRSNENGSEKKKKKQKLRKVKPIKLAEKEPKTVSTRRNRVGKLQLKTIIESLKNEPDLITARKALKYVPHYTKSQGLTKKLLKEVIKLWSEGGEKIRVVCLLCLIRIYSNVQDKELKQLILKKLYASFLEKCRITKQDTMSMIAFMRHSLIELYKLDPNLAFKQAQTSCQQLTVTLKNAYNHKNEDTYKTVLNWQFANCLILLSSLVSSHDDDSPVKALTHQVIQLNLGAINFLTSPRYYPYYCHLIDNLITLSIATKSFIPVLPIMLNIITRIECPHSSKLKKKPTDGEKNGVSGDLSDDEMNDNQPAAKRRKKMVKDNDTKPREYNIDLLNHVSLDEAHNPDYTSAVLERLHDLMVRYLASQCHTIAFPELVFLPTVQIKKWLRRNPGTPSQRFKTLLEKIKSDCQKVDDARKSVNFAFNDYTAIDAWQKKLLDSNQLVLPKMLNNE